MNFITKITLPKSKDILPGHLSGSHVPRNLDEVCVLPYEGLTLRRATDDEISDILPNAEDTDGSTKIFMLEMPDGSPIAAAAGQVEQIPLSLIVFTQTCVKVYGNLHSTAAKKKLENVIKSMFDCINDHATEVAQSADADFLALKKKPRGRRLNAE